MNKICRVVLFAGCSLLSVAQGGVIAGFMSADYDTAASSGGDAVASISTAGVMVGDLTELGAASFSTAGPGTINWQMSLTGTDLDSAIASGNFVQFTVDADEKRLLNLTSLTFNFGATQTTGTKVDLPVYTYLQISTNGTTFETVGSPAYRLVTVDESDDGVTVEVLNTATLDADLSAYAGLTEPVTFRVGAYMSEYNNSLRYIRGGDITLNGAVVVDADVIAGFVSGDYAAAAAGNTNAVASTSITGVTVGDMTELGDASFTAAGLGAINWQTSLTGTDLDSAIASGNFVQFTVDADERASLDLTALTFNFGATQDTSTKVDLPVYTYLQVSTNGTTFETVGSPAYRLVLVAETTNGVNSATLNTATLSADLSAYTGLTDPVTFRIGAYMSQYNNSLRYIRGGDVTLYGSVALQSYLSVACDGVGVIVSAVGLTSSAASNVLQVTDNLVDGTWSNVAPYSSGTSSNSWTMTPNADTGFFRILSY